ncbi:MAG TPA: hypothetical protein VK249_15625 [Anaerolineales bacterium]|nr:hypothetical protein [Anaerolineales bacterium]
MSRLTWTVKNMVKKPPIHPLEAFPRQELSFRISRKGFFTAIGMELKLRAQGPLEADAVRIPTLGALTDSQLMDFIPRILPGCEIEIRHQAVWGRLEDWSSSNFLFRLDALSSYCFNQINGINSLKAIAEAVAEEAGLPPERAFALTRGMFLTLVRAGVCLPVNNPLLG